MASLKSLLPKPKSVLKKPAAAKKHAAPAKVSRGKAPGKPARRSHK